MSASFYLLLIFFCFMLFFLLSAFVSFFFCCMVHESTAIISGPPSLFIFFPLMLFQSLPMWESTIIFWKSIWICLTLSNAGVLLVLPNTRVLLVLRITRQLWNHQHERHWWAADKPFGQPTYTRHREPKHWDRWSAKHSYSSAPQSHWSFHDSHFVVGMWAS